MGLWVLIATVAGFSCLRPQGIVLTQKKSVYGFHLTRGSDLWKARCLLQDNRCYNGLNALSKIGTMF